MRTIRSLWKHGHLLALVIGLRIVTTTLPFALWLDHTDSLSSSFLAELRGQMSGIALLSWTWLAALTLIGVAWYWSGELEGGLVLEAWRYRSFRVWLRGRALRAFAIPPLDYGLALLPFLLVRFPGEAWTCVRITLLLIVWASVLDTLFVVAVLRGVAVAQAFSGVLLFHAMNVMMAGAGLPSALTFFLLNERAGVVPCAAAIALCAAAVTAVVTACSPTAIMQRGGEAR